MHSIHTFFSGKSWVRVTNSKMFFQKQTETVLLVETDLHLMCLPAPRPSEMFINVGKVDGRDICYTGCRGRKIKGHKKRHATQMCRRLEDQRSSILKHKESKTIVKVEISSMSICRGLATGFTPMWILGDVFLRQAEFHDT